jgi:hypothetical protein
VYFPAAVPNSLLTYYLMYYTRAHTQESDAIGKALRDLSVTSESESESSHGPVSASHESSSPSTSRQERGTPKPRTTQIKQNKQKKQKKKGALGGPDALSEADDGDHSEDKQGEEDGDGEEEEEEEGGEEEETGEGEEEAAGGRKKGVWGRIFAKNDPADKVPHWKDVGGGWGEVYSLVVLKYLALGTKISSLIESYSGRPLGRRVELGGGARVGRGLWKRRGVRWH